MDRKIRGKSTDDIEATLTAASFQAISAERTTELNLLLSCPVPCSENVKRTSCIGDSLAVGPALAATSKTQAPAFSRTSRDRTRRGPVDPSQLFYPSLYLYLFSPRVSTDRSHWTRRRSQDATIFGSRIEMLSEGRD